MLDGLAIAQKVTHTWNKSFTYRAYTYSQSGLAIAIVINWELIASHGKQHGVIVKAKGYVYVFEQLLDLLLG